MANTTKLTWVEQLGYTLVILIDRQFMLWFPHGFCLGWTQTRWSSALPVQGQGSSTDNRSIERPSWGTVPSWRRREGWWWPRWPGGESTPLTGPGFGGHLCVLPMYCCQTRYWWLHGASAVREKAEEPGFPARTVPPVLETSSPASLVQDSFCSVTWRKSTHGRNSISSKSEQQPHPWLRDPATDVT